MTPKEAEQLAEIIETRKLLDNFYTGEWLCRDYASHSEVIQHNHHESHENCTGHLLIAKIVDGKYVYRRSIARLIARSPSMLQLLEKAFPIIEEEAERREFAPRTSVADESSYRSEMRDLANEISAEIDRAYGRQMNA